MIFSDSVNYNSIKFTDRNNGLAVGNTAYKNGFLLRTTDAGSNWNEIVLPTKVTDPEVDFTNDSTGYFVSTESGNIWRTTNGGKDWSVCFDTSSQVGTQLWDISFTDELKGVAGGLPLYLTSDAGTTWKYISVDLVFCSHASVKDNQILVSGDGLGYQSLLYSNDWGKIWTPLLVTDSTSINGISFLDKHNIWICGTSSKIDYNNSPNSPYGGFISKIDLSVLDTLKVPSMPVQVYPPNGATVSQSTSPNFEWTKSDYSYYRLQIAHDSLFTNFFEMVKASGDTVHLGDSLYSYNKLPIVEPSNQTYYWRVRAENKVGNSAWSETRRFTTSSVTGIKEKISPTQFKLSQNYPNPFNPTTTINYQIATDGHVSLIIYNVLGKEIAQLINKNEKAGDHSVNFDASNLPSGIYFYRLQAGSSMDIKKMILLK
jgi:hypothetical protein